MSNQHHAAPFTRPSFPPLASSAGTQSSAYRSYSSTSSLASESPASSAPLPSPSYAQTQHQGFFGSLNAHQQQQPQQQQQQSQATAQRQQLQRQTSYDYPSNRGAAGSTAAETNTYLDQYALIAEAAKRAQMAVVMRDIEGMEL